MTKAKTPKSRKPRKKKEPTPEELIDQYILDDDILPSHIAFALAIVRHDGNRVQAYLEVYGEKYKKEHGKELSYQGASSSANRLLKDVRIQEIIKEQRKATLIANGITAEKVLKRFENWAKGNIADYMKVVEIHHKDKDNKTVRVTQQVLVKTLDELTPDQRARIKAVKQTKAGISYELVDGLTANVKLANYLGIEKTNVEVSGKDGGPVEIDDGAALRKLIRSRFTEDEES